MLHLSSYLLNYLLFAQNIGIFNAHIVSRKQLKNQKKKNETKMRKKSGEKETKK